MASPASSDPLTRRVAWSTLVFAVLVILGGAIVRATDSGAGCGATWPRCEGRLFPVGPGFETIVEYGHRMSTAALSVGVAFLVLLAFRRHAKGHPVRRAAMASAGFLVGEILIGALIVVFGWVEADASWGRLLSVPIHLVNTFLLLGALTTTAWTAGGEGREPRWRGTGAWMLGALLVMGASGALNALADTLHPADSLASGVADELAAGAPMLLRLRVFHPLIAILGVGALVIGMARLAADGNERVSRLVAVVGGIAVLQVFVGVANIVLLTPVEIQALHLAVADALWIATVLLVLEATPAPVVPSSETPELPEMAR